MRKVLPLYIRLETRKKRKSIADEKYTSINLRSQILGAWFAAIVCYFHWIVEHSTAAFIVWSWVTEWCGVILHFIRMYVNHGFTNPLQSPSPFPLLLWFVILLSDEMDCNASSCNQNNINQKHNKPKIDFFTQNYKTWNYQIEGQAVLRLFRSIFSIASFDLFSIVTYLHFTKHAAINAYRGFSL